MTRRRRRSVDNRGVNAPDTDSPPATHRRRPVGRRRLGGHRVAAQARRPRGRRHLHEELGGRRRRRVLLVAPGLPRRGQRRRRASASRSSTSTSPPNTRTACSPSSCANTRPAARPTPTCCATPRSSSRPSSTTRSGSAPSRSRPATTRACATRAEGRFELLKGLDAPKDQSYFLHRLTQAQLARTLFPLGELAKTEVRRIAAEIGLPNAKKKDSTGICFIGERPFRDFLNRYLANTPGPIEDDRGRTIGEHVGLSFYTLGQRKGIGIGGLKERGAARGGSEHAPWFVAAQGHRAQHRSYVVQGHDHPWLLSSRLRRRRRELGRRRAAARPARYAAKTRYRQADAACTLASRPTSRRGRARLRRAAVGGDAGPVGGALRRRGLPRRRRDRLRRCHNAALATFVVAKRPIVRRRTLIRPGGHDKTAAWRYVRRVPSRLDHHAQVPSVDSGSARRPCSAADRFRRQLLFGLRRPEPPGLPVDGHADRPLGADLGDDAPALPRDLPDHAARRYRLPRDARRCGGHPLLASDAGSGATARTRSLTASPLAGGIGAAVTTATRS